MSSEHNSAQRGELEREVGHALARVLKTVFGYDSFRPLQREIMQASLEGRDAVAVLPTGAGKSLCYQLPALVREGLTVVASPLIALMKDQVDQMQAAGVAATFINSTLDADEFRARCAELDRGEHRILYVAPERLVTPEFLARLARWKVAALAVDEAHCISEWGHDFRPEYRQIRAVRRAFPHAPVLALTATATPGVQGDIATQLELRDPAVFVASFDRPNLAYRVVAKDDAREQTVAFVRSRGDESGIVYCQSRRSAEAVAGISFELRVIASVVIGGTSLMGGYGRIGGTIIGSIIMGILINGLVLMNVSAYYQQIITGLIIVLAVAFDTYAKSRRGAL